MAIIRINIDKYRILRRRLVLLPSSVRTFIPRFRIAINDFFLKSHIVNIRLYFQKLSVRLHHDDAFYRLPFLAYESSLVFTVISRGFFPSNPYYVMEFLNYRHASERIFRKPENLKPIGPCAIDAVMTFRFCMQ